MNLRQYISFFAIGTAIGWSAWILVLLRIDPVEAGTLALLMFYITLAMGLSGLITTTSTILRVVRFPDRDVEEVVITSIRQAILLTLLIIGALFLSSIELLNWWTMLLVVIVASMIEFLAIIAKKRREK